MSGPLLVPIVGAMGGPQGSAAATRTWEPVTGTLTSAEIVHRRIIGGPDDSDAIPIFDGNRRQEAREVLLSRAASRSPSRD